MQVYMVGIYRHLPTFLTGGKRRNGKKKDWFSKLSFQTATRLLRSKMFQAPRQREIWEGEGECRREGLEGREIGGHDDFEGAQWTLKQRSNWACGQTCYHLRNFLQRDSRCFVCAWARTIVARATFKEWGMGGWGGRGVSGVISMFYVDFWFSACGTLWFIDLVRALLHWKG